MKVRVINLSGLIIAEPWRLDDFEVNPDRNLTVDWIERGTEAELTEAKDFIDGYFRSYPSIKVYMDQSIQLARDQGYVTTIMGRRRYLPDIHSQNQVVRGVAERNAINSPIQGSAADIIKIAMVRIHEKIESLGLRSRMVLQVHDELNFDVYLPELRQLKEIVRHEMEHALQLRVPLLVDMGEGRNWLEAHG